MSFTILCVDDDPGFLLATKIVLKQRYKVYAAASYIEGMEIMEKNAVDLIFLDVHLGADNAITSISKIKGKYPKVDIVMLSAERDPVSIVQAIRRGALDYICKPCPADELLTIVEKSLKNKEVVDRYSALIENMNDATAHINFIGESDAFLSVLANARRLKGYNTSILIEGESGTGKELMARYLHEQEEDKSRPFIAVNCAAIPENLLESELFGYEQGAFTGASKKKVGKFELANGGDIFLDEINSLKPELQAKLLRVLQEKEFYRVGGTQSINVSFRVIAATNVDLVSEVRNGNFRQDLMYRLRVISLTMPSLRARAEDIDGYVDFFIKKHMRKDMEKFCSQEVLDCFKAYHWPGNIRELENIIQSLIIMSSGSEIELSDLPEWLTDDNGYYAQASSDPLSWLPTLTTSDDEHSLKDYMNEVEKAYIRRVIKLTGGNVTEAARQLKISRSKVYYTLKNEGIL
ncbi:MAG: sigma-54 dependent transcriptional regulator [bacterium]|nr:sigma-54 dependent transcriptional regulator [bacterium]